MMDSKFGTFEKHPLWWRIASRLLEMLKEKELNPGDKLPSERELAVMMQVSRPSLREGLRALSMMNVLEIRQGDGTYVTSLKPELLVEQLSFVLSLDDSMFIQLFEARKILEVGIVALAAQKITDEDIAELKINLDKAKTAMEKDPTEFLQADVELHQKITKAAQNPILSRMADSVSKMGLASRGRTGEFFEVRSQTLKDHKNIVKALEARDPEAAQKAMLKHLNNVGKKLEELISSESNEESNK